METRIELLKRNPVLGALKEESIRFLLEFTRTVNVAAGGFFFREHENAASMYILERGTAAVFKSWQGREMQLRVLKPGDCFGEMALMDMFPRSASIRALEDSTAIEVSPRGMVRLYGRDVEQFTLVQMNLGREVCRRLRDADERLFRVGMGEAGDETEIAFRTT